MRGYVLYRVVLYADSDTQVSKCTSLVQLPGGPKKLLLGPYY